jgi:peroxiredoxin
VDNRVHDLERDPRPTLLFFYARELKPCRAAFPDVERLTRRLEDLEARIWAVTADSHGDSLEVADQFQTSFPILLDPGGRVREALGLERLPAFVLLDARGLIQEVLQGWDPAAFRELAARMLASLGQEVGDLFDQTDWLPGA